MKLGVLCVLALGACFSKPTFTQRDAGSIGDDGGGESGGDDDAAIDAPQPFQLSLAKVSAGGRHVCAIGNDSRLWCWGDNDHGQLGDVTMTATGEPQLAFPTMANGWTDIAAGYDHTCGIHQGTAYCWGTNENKQSKPSVSGGGDTTVAVVNLPGTPTKVYAGQYASCARMQDSTVKCWGAVNMGADLGSGPDYTAFGILNLAIGSTTTFTAVAMGTFHACAIATDGRMYCWGDDQHNALGHDTGLNSHRAFISPAETDASAGSALRFTAVDASQWVTCAVTMQNRLMCWGYAGQGHLMNQPDGTLHAPIDNMQVWADVAVDETFACARKMDGTVQCWGQNQDGANGQGNFNAVSTTPATVDVGGLTVGMKQVVAGVGFACALNPNDNLWCWGANRQGELGNREIATKDRPSRVRLPALGANDVIKQIVGGFDFTCALVGPIGSDGTAYCWGRNETRQVDSLAASLAEEVPKLAFMPTTQLTFKELAVGEMHTCGRSSAGVITCWGDNSSRQLARTGSAGANMVPASTTGLPYSAVAAGSRGSCAISDGRLFCWGDVPGDAVQTTPKDYGRTASGWLWQSLVMGSGFAVGIATVVGETIPHMMVFGSNCASGFGTSGVTPPNMADTRRKGVFVNGTDLYQTLIIAASQHSGNHTCIHYTTQLDATTGRVACWGRNESFQVGQVEATCSGGNSDQVITPPMPWRIPVFGTQSIATANAHSCALGGNNQLYCWGANNNHELSDRITSTPGIPSPINLGAMTWSGVTTGNAHTCVVDDPHKAVYCWGENRHGQLGDGTRFRARPVESGLVLP